MFFVMAVVKYLNGRLKLLVLGILLLAGFMPASAQGSGWTGSALVETVDSLSDHIGFNLFEEDIDNVIFQTNEFLTSDTFTNDGGPFWWILEMCMALAALFAIIMAAGMAYKMMVKGEAFDVLKILKVLGIAMVMFCWYPTNKLLGGASVLGMLAYVPNCIGSYTQDLYEIEASQVEDKFKQLKPMINARDELLRKEMSEKKSVSDAMEKTEVQVDPEAQMEGQNQANEAWISSTFAGILACLDKLVILCSLMVFRIGWWSTIFCQQILLGMLTIFGPIMWAFSILPKWEGAWAKWITRYLTVHFYGAMLYFVGFYVLLLWDIVLSVQIDQMETILQDQSNFNGYLKDTIITGGYLLVASIVSLKCLNLVPDLAAWMIPEGDTAFSTRNFGEGVADQAKKSAMGLLK